MNTTRTPTPQQLHQTAQTYGITPLIRGKDEPLQAYLDNVRKQLPLDLPTYQQEALIEFATNHGVYPPAPILAHKPHLLEQWRATLDRHRSEHGARTILKQIAEHHEHIQARLREDATITEIAAELNCSNTNLRQYIRYSGLGNTQ